MGKLEGKIALVTGGNSGIGLATANEFARRVRLHHGTPRSRVGRGGQGDRKKCNRRARRRVEPWRSRSPVRANQARQRQARCCVRQRRGCAACSLRQDNRGALRRSLRFINVKGLLFTVQKALALMPDGASIILNASIVASKGSPELSVYSATKAAVRSFARTWTMDLKDRRIRVNAVSPGFIDTPGLSDLLVSSGGS